MKLVVTIIMTSMALPLQEIELSEALCGFHKVIKTLDDRELVIMSHPGDVIKHGKGSLVVNTLTIGLKGSDLKS